MSDLRQRRHEHVHAPVPETVKLLDARHPALRDRRSIFPSTVVDVDASPRLLVSGMNNRKIGRMVTKGEWAGMPIYTLTLEERATCPPSCHMWATCVVPGTRLLTSDLRWLPIETLEVGQRIAAFEEYPTGGGGRWGKRGRRSRIATVEALGRATLPCYRLVTDKGEIIASADHLWIARAGRAIDRRKGFDWRRMSDLRPGYEIMHLAAPWEVDQSYEGGRIRGFVEGEGYVSSRHGGAADYNHVRLGWSQKPGRLFDEINTLIAGRGFTPKFSSVRSGVNKSNVLLGELRGWREVLRFLGTFSPTRLMDKAEGVYVGHIFDGRGSEHATVLAVEPIGDREVVTISTSERTMIAEGFLAHNCYGNAMNWARRHRHGGDLVRRLEQEIAAKAAEHPKGFVVRLHVLGDFYSVAYVDFWSSALHRHPELHVFGYTARRTDGDVEDRAIAMRIAGLNGAYADRFVIRTSSPEPGPMRAVVIDRIPEEPRVPEGIVCPAETQATSCCAECGLCWAPAARKESIAFIRHGLGSRNDAALARRAATGPDGMRPVEPLALGLASADIAVLSGVAPYFVEADPRTLLIDEAYQRGLSVRGIKLIRDMVLRWDWSKFKPPVVTETADGRRFAIDGQHTAIAAASHPEIDTIPIQVIDAGSVARRAQAFLGHNRDRITVTPLQLHRALVASEDPVSVTIDRICQATGARMLATPPPTGVFQMGETMALASIRGLIEKRGEKRARNVLMVCVQGRCAPISADHIKAVDFLIHGDDHLRHNYPWHGGELLDASDVALFMRARGAELIRQATMRRMETGRTWARWVLLAQDIYAGMKEVAHG